MQNILFVCGWTLVAFVAGWFLNQTRASWAREDPRISMLREYLERLRKQVPGNSGHAGHIESAVVKGITTYEQLGTSLAEIRELGNMLSAKQSALCCLDSLRHGYGDGYEKTMALLPQNLFNAGLTLERLGSDQHEFESFPEQIQKRTAKGELGQFRYHISHAAANATWVVNAVKKGVPTDELQISDFEEFLLVPLAESVWARQRVRA